jgi:hypothetical protein
MRKVDEYMLDGKIIGGFTVLTAEELAAIPEDRSPYDHRVPNADCIGCWSNAGMFQTQLGREVDYTRSVGEDFFCVGEGFTDHDEREQFVTLVQALRRGFVLVSDDAPMLPYDAEDRRPICESCRIQVLDDPNFCESPLMAPTLTNQQVTALRAAAEHAIRERYKRFREASEVDPAWTLKAALPEEMRGWYGQGEAYVANMLAT